MRNAKLLVSRICSAQVLAMSNELRQKTEFAHPSRWRRNNRRKERIKKELTMTTYTWCAVFSETLLKVSTHKPDTTYIFCPRHPPKKFFVMEFFGVISPMRLPPTSPFLNVVCRCVGLARLSWMSFEEQRVQGSTSHHCTL